MHIIKLLLVAKCVLLVSGTVPIVVNTWQFPEATSAAWEHLQKSNNAVDALEAGCSKCETLQCDGTVGYGGSPDENGETTLDAMIFDGETMDMGAVGGLRRIKSAISVAKVVLKHTSHSLLVGDLATNFAIEMGFDEESLSTNSSHTIWKDWKQNNCQPNYWINVHPDHQKVCGPYRPISENSIDYNLPNRLENKINDVNKNHDTIGMVVINENKHVVAGTSTNGLRHKIPGRVGDSPIPGAGAYADNAYGGAAATGDGDVMMRFLPSFIAVEEMRQGATPKAAARTAIARIVKKYQNFTGAIIAVNMNGEYGAACNGMESFPYAVANAEEGVHIEFVHCI